MFCSLVIHVITRAFNTFAFIYMLWKNYVDLNINTKSINYNNSFWPILVQCHISVPPENVRKPLVFWRFQGV